jgi:hypothetical protein
MKVLLQVHDGAIPLLPDVLLVAQFFGQPLAAENLRMHSNDQHFLVIRAVEDADPSAFGKAARGAPEKIVIELFCTGLLEAEDLAAFWIDPDMTCRMAPSLPAPSIPWKISSNA